MRVPRPIVWQARRPALPASPRGVVVVIGGRLVVAVLLGDDGFGGGGLRERRRDGELHADGTMIGAHDLRRDPGVDELLFEIARREEVVDAPAFVLLARIHARLPEGVLAREVTFLGAKGVDEARREKLVHP